MLIVIIKIVSNLIVFKHKIVTDWLEKIFCVSACVLYFALSKMFIVCIFSL